MQNYLNWTFIRQFLVFIIEWAEKSTKPDHKQFLCGLINLKPGERGKMKKKNSLNFWEGEAVKGGVPKCSRHKKCNLLLDAIQQGLYHLSAGKKVEAYFVMLES